MIELLQGVTEKAEELIKASLCFDGVLTEEISSSDCSADNIKTAEAGLYLGDNLSLLKKLVKDRQSGDLPGIQFVYIDPPFFSEADYDEVIKLADKNVKVKAYSDRWSDGLEEYLVKLSAVLIMIRELLTDSGMVALHLDWHASHYARILLDEIFGASNFVNEIIWTYKSGGSTKKHFARKHDNILLYSKTSKYKFNIQKEKSYNRGLKPYKFKGVEEFRDDAGWYTLVNMKDIFEIDMVGRTSGERTGYATQKPVKLMERLIESCSDRGDLVADFFSGSGAFPVAALGMGRDVILSDVNPCAIDMTIERMEGLDVPCHGEIYVDANGDDTSAAELDVEVSSSFDSESGKLKVAIDSISEASDGRFDKTSMEHIDKVLAGSPEELIKSWSIGFDDGSGVLRPFVKLRRDKDGNLPLEYEFEIDDPNKKDSRIIIVKVSDVFGDFVYKSLAVL